MERRGGLGGGGSTQIFREREFTFEAFINQYPKTTGDFPGSLKLGSLILTYKKDNPLDKSNYRPVSILLFLSKVYKRITYTQSSQHTKQFLKKILCGFQKAHSTQHPLSKLF